MNIIVQLIFNPAIISLFVGIILGSSCCSFAIPTLVADIVSIYLIFIIGLKGGMCLGAANQCTPPLIALTLIGIAIGFVQPFINYYVLKRTTTLDKITTGIIAAQYGSISIITFITALTFLDERGIGYDTFLTATAGLMEIPAIFSGLWLIKHKTAKSERSFFTSLIKIAKAIITCKKINFLFVGFFTGVLLRALDAGIVSDALLWPFSIALIIFMINIGMKIAEQKSSLRHFSPALIAFGIYMPILSGCIGLLIAHQFVEFLGSKMLFALLLASASYIAVPAIMSTQTDDAKEVIYLPLALGITLPFNILIGIPLYYYLASAL